MKSNTETSIIKSNVRQINLSNENIKYKHWCFQLSKIVSPKKFILAFQFTICHENIYLRYISDYGGATTN